MDGQLEKADCSMKTRMQVELAAEEIFVNIASYAYAPGTGNAAVRVEFPEDGTSVTISFTDRGKAYDPLSRDDPDISLPAEQRDVGGLGILMTKKLMDELSYAYRDGQNVLTMKKRL